MTFQSLKQSSLIIWLFSGIIAFFAAIIPTFKDNLDAFELRSLAIGLAFFLATIIILYQNQWRIGNILGETPDSVALILSAVVGVCLWFLAWWLMAWVQEDILTTTLDPPEIYRFANWEHNWTGLVLVDVVMIPLFLFILLWGAMHTVLAKHSVVYQGGVLAVVFAVLGMILFGNGFVGVIGYGLVGVIIALVLIATRSAWYGLVIHGAFAYANFALYKDLLRFSGLLTDTGVPQLEPYFGQKWLTGVMVASFLLLVSVQFIRIRHQMLKHERPETGMQSSAADNHLLSIGILLFVCMLTIAYFAVLSLQASEYTN